MARRSRLHVPGGLYYVMQRGFARQAIFSSPDDYTAFEQLLAVTLARCRARVHAYCWEPTAIHLALQIGVMPVGRLMQRLTSQFARSLHRRRGVRGHLFQERYHAILVDPQAHLLDLVRFIHLAPVRAQRVTDPVDCQWTSHRAYLGHATVPWLSKDAALQLLSSQDAPALEAYEQLMRRPHDPNELRRFERGSSDDPRVLGDRTFLSIVPQQDGPYCNVFSLERIIDSVANTVGVSRAEIMSPSRRRTLTLARALITWQATEQGVATLSDVARRLGRDPSTLLVAVARYRALHPDLFEGETTLNEA